MEPDFIPRNVYLAGPMSMFAKTGWNADAFDVVEQWCLDRWPDADVYNPARLDREAGMDFEAVTSLDQIAETYGPTWLTSRWRDNLIALGHADIVVVLARWGASNGTRLEVACALKTGIPIVHSRNFKPLTAFELEVVGV